MSWTKATGGKISENFSYLEAACNHCGCITDQETIKKTAAMMETIRVKLGGKPIKVLSWCRCEQHNSAVGGASDSYHMKGMAVDFVVKHMTPRQVQAALKDHNGGLGKYLGWTHCDIGPKRRWSG